MTAGQPAGAERPSERTLVIIPTFNERENLELIVGRVHQARPDVHVLVVDDGSPDGTGEIADDLAMADPDRVHVMHRAGKNEFIADEFPFHAKCVSGALHDSSARRGSTAHEKRNADQALVSNDRDFRG